VSIYELIINTLKPLNISVTINQNADKSANKYVTLIPLYDGFDEYADNKPTIDIKEVEIAIYSKGNYLELVEQITRYLIDDEFTITNRKYIEYEEDTKLHHYVIDVSMEFCY
jgi:hypothetical protein